jgi:3-hydroxymyristoyl/3-hydroxydecanoyl-(acyl carrier protein) dehydratase
VLISSPAHLGRLPASLGWHAARTGLRAVFSSGGPLAADAAHDALNLLGHSPIEVYGSSETGGVAWRQRAAGGESWRPLPKVAWRIEGECLAVQSPHLPDEAWWTTSDRVQAVEHGSFRLLGRSDRVVKIEQKRVSLTALECRLLASPWLDEARALLLAAPSGLRVGVVGVTSDAGHELLKRQGRRGLGELLREQLEGSVERVALPRRWRFVEAMPTNAQGKTTEALLASLFKPVRPRERWLERGALRARIELAITADLAVFDGHFESSPILPGVAQVDWAIAYARECFALPARFLRLEVLKFQQPVLPGIKLTLTMEWQPATHQLAFKYQSEAGLHSGGRAVFGAQDTERKASAPGGELQHA